MSELWVKDENGERDYGSSENAMVERMFTNPDLFCELYGRKDKYGGDTRGLYESGMARAAGSYAERLGGDRLVTRGIYLGVAVADPVFDEVGEEFLRRVLPDYSKADYAEDMFRGMLFGVKTSRKEIIVRGIRDIIEGNDNDTIEVRTVKVFIKIKDYFMAVKVRDHNAAQDIYFLFDNSLSNAKNYQGINDIEEQYQYAYNVIEADLDELEAKGLIASPLPPDFSKLDLLMRAYEYFMENFDKIPYINFLRLFPQYADNKAKLVAYYVATRPDEGLISYMEDVFRGDK